jgi:hypothetical protein
MKQENTKTSIASVLLIALIGFSSFMVLIFILEFADNYKIITNENQFKKMKVKIDSTNTSSTRSGKSSASSTSTTFYFKKGHLLSTSESKGIILNKTSYQQEINEYMSDHQDSLNIWYLDNNTAKFAYEDQKKIDISEEVKNNNNLKIFFLIYILLLSLFLKFKNKFSTV